MNHDPITDEPSVASKGGGAMLKEAPTKLPANKPQRGGKVSVGYANHVTARKVLPGFEL